MSPQQHKLVFAAACVGILLFGITLTTLGSILPEVIARFGISKANAGTQFTVMNLGVLLGVLFFGPVVDRYGYKLLLIVCSAILFTGLEGIAFASTMQWFTIFIFFFGFGGGVINGASNALVADISKEGKGAAIALLGVFFSLGAFGVPLTLGSLLDIFTYTQIMGALGLIVILAIFMFLFIRFPTPKQQHNFPVQEAIGLIKHSTLLLLSLMLFFQSGMEMMAGGWIATYFNEVLAIDASRAVLLLSFFWIGMMVSRIFLSRILYIFSAARVLTICMAITFTGAIILLLVSGITLATIGVFIIGAGLGAGFPVLLGYIGALFPEMSGTAYGIALTIALTGGMSIPNLAGIIGDNFGLRVAFLIIPVSIVSMMLIFIIVRKKFAKDTEKIINA